MGSTESRRQKANCGPKPRQPHSSTPRHRCKSLNLGGRPRRFFLGISAWQLWLTQATRCSCVGTGNDGPCFDTLSWVMGRSSFLLAFQDRSERFSFFLLLL